MTSERDIQHAARGDAVILPLNRIHDAACVAVRCWGPEPQWRMLQEECGELVAAINQRTRGRISGDQLAEECADVLILLIQARRMLGRGVFDRAVETKLARLEERLSKRGGDGR